MIDISKTVTPRSDQANFDDFASGESKTIKIRDIKGSEGEQPIWIYYEGDNDKPYKPCLSMRRVLLRVWGKDGKTYIGRLLTLYGDPKVKFGGLEVGGIRISHMSHITSPVTMALTTTKASRKPFTVQPLAMEASTPTVDDYIVDIQAIPTIEGLKHKFAEATRIFKDSKDFARIHAAKEKRKAELVEPEAKS